MIKVGSMCDIVGEYMSVHRVVDGESIDEGLVHSDGRHETRMG